MRRETQEDEEVRRGGREEGQQRWDGWWNWREEQMESFCTRRLGCAGEGKSGTAVLVLEK